ncbi:MAG: IS66 family insertion sequence element accessory protein TnpB [Pirellulaceae bacterium]
MLSLPCVVRIYLHVQPVNLHLGFDRLANLVREDMGQDPLGGHLFVFRNVRSVEPSTTRINTRSQRSREQQQRQMSGHCDRLRKMLVWSISQIRK